MLSFFGDGASKQGAFHETLNIASLWKLPVVFVMENNNYQAYTRVEQEDANAAAGEPLAVKAKAQHAGRHRRRRDPSRSTTSCTRPSSARGRARGRLVESLVYRLSAHGNIIAAARRAAALPGARGDPRLRQRRGVRGGSAATPCLASARGP